MSRFRLFWTSVLAALALTLAPAAPGATPTRAQDHVAQMERHYLAMMVFHHQDAVNMAELAEERATHEELRELARAIKDEQRQEIATLREWLQTWYGETPERALPMGPHGPVGGMDEGMMGMMAQGHTAYLGRLEGAAFEQAFMNLMIGHHAGAVMMSQMVVDTAPHEEVRSFATDVITKQSAEIAQMRSWLDQWYGQPPE
ncbi:MAG: DUF305 domain-containing protein [Chloroflexi bacterium]|nr:DUF305 domain-containing protein [Chloroflexota bacterium]